MIESIDGVLTKRLGDGRWLQIMPLTFGRARLCVGPEDTDFYDDGY